MTYNVFGGMLNLALSIYPVHTTRVHGPWIRIMWTGTHVHGLCSLVSKTSAVNMGHEHGRLSKLPMFTGREHGKCVPGLNN